MIWPQVSHAFNAAFPIAKVNIHQHNIRIDQWYFYQSVFSIAETACHFITGVHHNDLFQREADLLIILNNANGNLHTVKFSNLSIKKIPFVVMVYLHC
jgi:hypothetical protein